MSPGDDEAGSQTPEMSRVEVVAPNFKKRLSGVTSTIVQLAPLQARDLGIVTLGPGLPPGLPDGAPSAVSDAFATRRAPTCSSRR